MSVSDRRPLLLRALGVLLAAAALVLAIVLVRDACGAGPAEGEHPGSAAAGQEGVPRVRPERSPAAQNGRSGAGEGLRRPTAEVAGSRSEADGAETAASNGGTPEEGGPCDDGDPCTLADRLRNGRCGGEPFSCDDDDPATLDECAADGCVHRPAEAVEEPRP